MRIFVWWHIYMCVFHYSYVFTLRSMKLKHTQKIKIVIIIKKKKNNKTTKTKINKKEISQ